ncbi:hypothetical protein ACN47E_008662 [Coniothyrium glycines]
MTSLEGSKTIQDPSHLGKRHPSPTGVSNRTCVEEEEKFMYNIELRDTNPCDVEGPLLIDETKLGNNISAFLGLPAELLHTIASELCRTGALHSLALVNRRLKDVAQHAMLHDVVVTKKGMRKLLETLMSKPLWREKVVSVVLKQSGCACHRRCCCMDVSHFSEQMAQFYSKCLPGVNNTTSNGTFQFSTKGNVSILDIVVIVLPNLKSLALELPQADCFDAATSPSPLDIMTMALVIQSNLPLANPKFRSATLLQGRALGLLQDRLRTLIISPDSQWKGPMETPVFHEYCDLMWAGIGRSTITLSGFTRLACLDIALKYLGRAETINFDEIVDESLTAEANMDVQMSQHTTLPRSLQRLRLHDCGQTTFQFLARINDLTTNSMKIKYIDLICATSVTNLIISCHAEDSGKLDYRQTLRSLEQAGISTSFCDSRNQKIANMASELHSLAVLSPLEAWSLATTQYSFGDLNVQASLRRRVSYFEHLLFMDHMPVHFDLLNSETFMGVKWKDVAFFHGEPSPLHSMENVMAESVSRLGAGTRKLGRRMHPRFDLFKSKFHFRMRKPDIGKNEPVVFMGQTYSGRVNFDRKLVHLTDVAQEVIQDTPEATNKPRMVYEEHRKVRAERVSKIATQQTMADPKIPEVSTETYTNIEYTISSGFAAQSWSIVGWNTVLRPQSLPWRCREITSQTPAFKKSCRKL